MAKIKSAAVMNLSILSHYYVVSEPCTAIVKVGSKVSVLINDYNNPRYLVNLRVGLKDNLDELSSILEREGEIPFKSARDYFITGALFKSSLKSPDLLPVKGEEVVATFDYVDDVIMCTGLSLLPRTKLLKYDPYTYNVAKDTLDQIVSKL